MYLFKKICQVFIIFFSVKLLCTLLGVYNDAVFWFLKTLEILCYLFYLCVFIKRKEWFRKEREFFKSDWKKYIGIGVIVIILIVVGICNMIFVHDLPMGRDNMAYIATAAKIDQEGSFIFQDEFLKNFKPFVENSQGEYVSQFLPGYSVLLNAFYRMGGFELIVIANSLLIITISIVLLFVGRLLFKKEKNRYLSYLWVVMVLCNYVVVWFSRRTVSELLFMLLMWVSFFFVLESIKRRRLVDLLVATNYLLIALMTRGEAILFVGSIVFVLGYLVVFNRLRLRKMKKYVYLWAGIILLNIFNLIFYIFRVKNNYYTNIGTQYVESLVEMEMFYYVLALFVVVVLILWQRKIFNYMIARAIIAFIVIGYFIYKIFNELGKVEGQDRFKWFELDYYYMFVVQYRYGLLLLLGLTLIGFVFKYYSRLQSILFFILLPSCLFLVKTGIASDQPWFMRRFLPIFIPFVSLYAVITVYNLFKKKRSLVIFTSVFIVGLGLFSTSQIFAFKENSGMYNNIKELSSSFSENDLVIMRPGWEWQQWSYAMYFLNNVKVIPDTHKLSQNDIESYWKDAENVYYLNQVEEMDLKKYYPYDGTGKLTDKKKYNYDVLIREMDIHYDLEMNAEYVWGNYVFESMKRMPPTEKGTKEQQLYVFKVK